VTPDLNQLASVIHLLHGGHATHRESVPIKETWQGKTVWEGIVEVFDLEGHPKTDTAYAWSHLTDDPKNPIRSIAVLKFPPVVSPITAVRAALLQEHRNAPSA
jgi:hypothetical protein